MTFSPPHLSYSAYNSYANRCGKAYELERIMGAPRRPAWWFIGGSLVHDVTEAHDRAWAGFGFSWRGVRGVPKDRNHPDEQDRRNEEMIRRMREVYMREASAKKKAADQREIKRLKKKREADAKKKKAEQQKKNKGKGGWW